MTLSLRTRDAFRRAGRAAVIAFAVGCISFTHSGEISSLSKLLGMTASGIIFGLIAFVIAFSFRIRSPAARPMQWWK